MHSTKSLVCDATSNKECVPDQRHLNEIVKSCFSSPANRKKILHILNERLDTGDFIIHYKASYVLHYILNKCFHPNSDLLIIDAHQEFVSHALHKEHFHSPKYRRETHLIYIFYYSYLLSRLVMSFKDYGKFDMVNLTQLDLLKNQKSETRNLPENGKTLSMPIIVKTITIYQKVLSVLLKNKFNTLHIEDSNSLFHASYVFLLADLMIIYNIMTEAIRLAVEGFLDADLDTKKKICSLYDDYVTLTYASIEFWKVGKESGMKLQSLEPYDTTLSKVLRENLRSPDNPNSGRGNVQDIFKNEVTSREKLEAISGKRQGGKSELTTTYDNKPPAYEHFSEISKFSPQDVKRSHQLENVYSPSGAQQQERQQAGYQRPVSRLPQQPEYYQPVPQPPQLPAQIAYQQAVPQKPTGSQQAVPQKSTGYQQAVPQQQTGYQQDVPQQQTGYQQNVTQQQTGYQQAVPQKSTGYQQAVPQQQTGYQQNDTQQQTGYQQNVPQQQTGYQQNVTQQQSGYQQAVPQQPTGLQQAVPQQPAGLQQDVPQQQTGYQQAVTQQPTGYQSSAPVEHPGYQQPVPTQNSNPRPSVGDFSNVNKENDPIPSKHFNPFSVDNYQREHLESYQNSLYTAGNQSAVEEGIEYDRVNPKTIINQFNQVNASYYNEPDTNHMPQ